MSPFQPKEDQKTGRQIRTEILEALSSHDILNTQQLALHVDQTLGLVVSQLFWLRIHYSIERVAYLSDDYTAPGRLLYWNVFWAMTNHARHHLKKHFADCAGCRVREMEAKALARAGLARKVIRELG